MSGLFADHCQDVLFRFGDEEDAVKAKVDEYSRGSNEIIQTLTETWTERLNHEHGNLMDGLKAESQILTTASQLIGKQNSGAWKELICNEDNFTAVQRKRESLKAKIEALNKRGSRSI